MRVAVHGRYLIFYAAGDDHTVVIERILHGSRHLERRILRLNRGDSGRGYFVIRFRQEVVRDAQALFAGSA